MKKILGILGATGVGKSEVAIEVAKMLNSMVISCDSMQVYRGLDVSTAKISSDQMQGVRHFMLDVVSPNQSFSAFDYQNAVVNEVFPIFQNQGAVPIVAGGTGLYYESLIYGLDFGGNDQTTQIRNQMNKLLEREGLDGILEVLKQKDEVAYQKIDKANARRIIRAIEIASTGSSVYENEKRSLRYQNLPFVLFCDRETMYKNIENRVDRMVENGLFDEIAYVFEQVGKDDKLQSMQAIGCKEIVAYLQQKCTKQQAIDAIKINTRHYAKRQVTFFKRLDCINLDVAEFKNSRHLAERIVQLFHESANFELLCEK